MKIIMTDDKSQIPHLLLDPKNDAILLQDGNDHTELYSFSENKAIIENF